ncbi:30S ribosome-binding factor RbfA [Rheinheimera nanhaiensis]|uniref:Ribosome-binding factor A n=1 Tax=Rheinheimera nanhaiensis E407-8 TaxID=562729 RepID=I1E246_9GAMM|nr:30S ribosome-binding factor RbfA [Rheinheimera nanhaiensis]GAB60374.1 ribosome-binding factor A [Rheinheimera nanhaiensis E407-8]
MKEFSRVDRLSQQMKKEMAVILQREIKDPRLHSMITVSDVEVSRDLSHAKVFVTFLGLADDKVEDNLKILNDASGFVRSLIGKRIQARIVPHIRFVFDESLNEGIRMANLVSNARAEDDRRRLQSGQALDDGADAAGNADKDEPAN